MNDKSINIKKDINNKTADVLALVERKIVFFKDVIQKTISIRKSRKIDLPDAIIAATALVYDFTLITQNMKDFEKIQGLKTLNSFDL